MTASAAQFNVHWALDSLGNGRGTALGKGHKFGFLFGLTVQEVVGGEIMSTKGTGSMGGGW